MSRGVFGQRGMTYDYCEKLETFHAYAKINFNAHKLFFLSKFKLDILFDFIKAFSIRIEIQLCNVDTYQSNSMLNKA